MLCSFHPLPSTQPSQSHTTTPRPCQPRNLKDHWRTVASSISRSKRRVESSCRGSLTYDSSHFELTIFRRKKSFATNNSIPTIDTNHVEQVEEEARLTLARHRHPQPKASAPSVGAVALSHLYRRPHHLEEALLQTRHTQDYRPQSPDQGRHPQLAFSQCSII